MTKNSLPLRVTKLHLQRLRDRRKDCFVSQLFPLDDVEVTACADVSKMADHSITVARMARLLSIAHIIVGVLLLGFGIADGVMTTSYHYSDFWSGHVYFGVWIGIWVSSYFTAIHV